MNKKLLVVLLFSLVAFAPAFALADDTATTDATVEITATADTSAKALGLKDQTLLPDSPFYFLKNWGRAIQSVFTFNKVGKLELKQKFSNERLLELQKLAEKTANSEVLKNAVSAYSDEIDKIKEQAQNIKDNATDSTSINKFLDKFANQQVLQEKILQKLEGQVPAEVLAKIKEARENHLEKFKDVMTKLEDNKDNMIEKIENAVGTRDYTATDVLDKIKEKMPEDIKTKLETLKAKILDNMQERECATDVECLQINCVGISSPASNCINLKAKCVEGKCKIVNINNECTTDSDCPQLNCLGTSSSAINCTNLEGKCVEGKCTLKSPTPDSACKNLWWYDSQSTTCLQKQFCGTYMYYGLKTFETKEKCALDLKPTVCPTLWDPVCGKDGNTYGNECSAKVSGTEVDYDGTCVKKAQ